jgi:DNA-binding response OmpR family regulator
MKTRSIPTSLSAGGYTRARGSVRNCCGPRSPNVEKRAILLVSDDASLGENLKCAAAQTGRAVVQVDGTVNALRKMRAGQSAIVLLDLDLPSQVAWEAADCLLQEESCPPLLLLTARSDQFDLGTAIRAGSLIDKTTSPSRLLELVDQTLAGPCSAQAERNAIQRVMIRWLRPCGWSVPVTSSHRFTEMNE